MEDGLKVDEAKGVDACHGCTPFSSVSLEFFLLRMRSASRVVRVLVRVVSAVVLHHVFTGSSLAYVV